MSSTRQGQSPGTPGVMSVQNQQQKQYGSSGTLSERSSRSDHDRSELSEKQGNGLGLLSEKQGNGLGLLSPSNSGSVIHRASFGWGTADTTPRRAPSIAVSDIKSLIGDSGANALENDLHADDGDHFDADDEDKDDEGDSDDSDESDLESDMDAKDIINSYDESSGSSSRCSCLFRKQLHGLRMDVRSILYMQNATNDIVNQHSDFLHSVEHQQVALRAELQRRDGHNYITHFVANGFESVCAGIPGVSILRDVYVAVGVLPFLGSFLQLLLLLNTICVVWLVVPRSICAAVLTPLTKCMALVLGIIFKPLLHVALSYLEVESLWETKLASSLLSSACAA